jgi:hypothetical protein
MLFVALAVVAVPVPIAALASVTNRNEDAGGEGQRADKGEGDQTNEADSVVPHGSSS